MYFTSTISKPSNDRIDMSHIALIKAEARPISSAEYKRAAINQKKKPEPAPPIE